MAELGLAIAFIAGLLSFLSPCVLPLIPAFFSYMSGVSSADFQSRRKVVQARVFANTIFFVLGFSIVFSLLGVLINSVLSGIGYDLKVWAGRVGGVIIIIFALHVLRIIRIPFLEAEHRIRVGNAVPGYAGSFVFGATFAAGWTPCVGAILGSIFTLAITQPGSAFYLLLAYSLGLGIPFLLVGLFTSQFYRFIARSGKFLKYFNIVTGILLLALGILVFTGKLSVLASFSPLNDLIIRLGV